MVSLKYATINFREYLIINNKYMIILNPYLNFNGNTEEAFNFYKSVFGGEFSAFQRFKDTPVAADVPKGAEDGIMHVALPIGKNNILMATDAVESMGQKLIVGNNISLSLNVDSEEEADKYFKLLAAGGKITMALEKAFWGSYFGMTIDKFGIQWMISYDPKQE
jgi:PhnB protein